jgi:hypothetical protein
MTKAKVTRINTIEIQGIKLVDVTFVTVNGIEATARANSYDDFEVGQTYLGNLKYAPCSNIRIFEPRAKVNELRTV